MTKHKREDHKNSAVKYYLNNDKGDGYKKTCYSSFTKNIFSGNYDYKVIEIQRKANRKC